MHIVCVVGRILEMASQGSHILVSQNTFLGNALKRLKNPQAVDLKI